MKDEKKTRFNIFWLVVLGIVFFLPLSGANARADMGGWSSPIGGPAGWWIAPRINADATRAVFLDPYTTSGPGTTDDFYYDRRVMAADFTNGAWGSAVVVGSNAMARSNGWMPVVTHPVISADGNTIAYLGCTGGCKPFTIPPPPAVGDRYDIYVSSRVAGGWSTPVVVYTGTASLSELISLSADGNTLVYSNNNGPFGSDPNRVYVIMRTGGTWGTPVAVDEGGQVYGWSPEVSQNGQQVIWISNPPTGSGIYWNVLLYSHQTPGGWSAPQVVDTGADFDHKTYQYRFTPDGNSLYYWNIELTGNVCTGQDLYILRRSGHSWSAPQKINTTQVIPLACDAEAPAGMDSNGTRAVYPQNVKHNDVIDQSFLEVVDFKNGVWGAPVTITNATFPYYSYPNLSTDGTHLISNGTDPSGGGAALIRMDSLPRQNHWVFLPMVKK